MFNYQSLALITTITVVLAQSTYAQNSTPACTASNDITPYCDFKNPEDLTVLPGGNMLLVSEMGEFMLDSPGALVLLDLHSRKKSSISINWQTTDDNWGDATCPVPDADMFSPHGFDLMTRSDSRHQLLVVNHGGRESVEFFELTNNGDWQLQWRGCVLPPGDPFINDVAGLLDGGLLVTHMWDKSSWQITLAAKLLTGITTGWVWEWQAETGFSKLPGSKGLMPNGIVVSQDNKSVFVNIYMANKTIKIDRELGTVVGEFAVRQPDNITLDSEGYLWIASHQHSVLSENCNEVKAGPCLLPFEVIRANPETLETEVILSQDGDPMGYATVALQHKGEIFLGSAHGDRIASFKLLQQ